MTLDNFIIREIQPEDNPKIATAIRDVLIEYGVPKVGTAYADTVLNTLFEMYNNCKKLYKKVGFKNLTAPIENANHYSHNLLIIKYL